MNEERSWSEEILYYHTGELPPRKDQLVAWRQTTKAIREGKLKQIPCVVCRNPKSEAHHEDYSKPLDVIWLCRRCHRAWHYLLEHPSFEVIERFRFFMENQNNGETDE